MKPGQGSREHLSKRQPRLAAEFSRNLLGRWLDKAEMVSSQHRALHEATKDNADFTMPRRSTDPYDPSNQERMLRGIPVNLKGGMGGAINGTKPGRGKAIDDWSGWPTADDDDGEM